MDKSLRFSKSASITQVYASSIYANKFNGSINMRIEIAVNFYYTKKTNQSKSYLFYNPRIRTVQVIPSWTEMKDTLYISKDLSLLTFQDTERLTLVNICSYDFKSPQNLAFTVVRKSYNFSSAKCHLDISKLWKASSFRFRSDKYGMLLKLSAKNAKQTFS